MGNNFANCCSNENAVKTLKSDISMSRPTVKKQSSK